MNRGEGKEIHRGRGGEGRGKMSWKSRGRPIGPPRARNCPGLYVRWLSVGPARSRSRDIPLSLSFFGRILLFHSNAKHTHYRLEMRVWWLGALSFACSPESNGQHSRVDSSLECIHVGGLFLSFLLFLDVT